MLGCQAQFGVDNQTLLYEVYLLQATCLLLQKYVQRLATLFERAFAENAIFSTDDFVVLGSEEVCGFLEEHRILAPFRVVILD